MNPSEREIRDVTEHQGRVFDVQPSLDDQSLNYPVTLVLPTAVPPQRRVWGKSTILNQGQEGACVGHGVTAELAGSPARVDFTHARLPAGAPHEAQGFAFWLYHAAQRVDEYAGENYSGTSVNAGMKVARDAGFYDSWYWISTREQFRDTLITKGPVVIAIPWLAGMYEAPGGELVPEGNEVGWHCILANGYDPALAWNGQPPREMARLQNSWGPEWGHNGLAWITMDRLWNRLLSVKGADMAVPVGRHLLRVA